MRCSWNEFPQPCQLHSNVLVSTDHVNILIAHLDKNQVNLQPLSCTRTNLAKYEDGFSKSHVQVCRNSEAHQIFATSWGFFAEGKLWINQAGQEWTW